MKPFNLNLALAENLEVCSQDGNIGKLTINPYFTEDPLSIEAASLLFVGRDGLMWPVFTDGRADNHMEACRIVEMAPVQFAEKVHIWKDSAGMRHVAFVGEVDFSGSPDVVVVTKTLTWEE